MQLTPFPLGTDYSPQFLLKCFEKQPSLTIYPLVNEPLGVIIVLMMKDKCTYLLRQG
jgi:hypothetical protein